MVLGWWSKSASATSSRRSVITYSISQIGSLCFLIVLAWHFFYWVVANSGQNLHQALLETVANAPLELFNVVDIGSIVNRFSQDIGVIDSELPVALLNTLIYLFSCIAQLILSAMATRYTVAVFPVLILILYLIARYYLRTSRQLRVMDLETRGPLYTQLIEMVRGIATVRAFGWESKYISHSQDLLDRSQRPYYLLLMIQRWLILVLSLVCTGLVLIVIGLGYHLKNSVDIGLFGISITGIISFSQSITGFITVWTTLETSLGAVARIRSFSESVVSEEPDRKIISPPDNWPRNGKIEFCDVSASYNPGSGSNALSKVSFTIHPGEKIGVCGRSGSGKSSLLLALTQLLGLTNGRILIDGLDLSCTSRNIVRARLNVIPQDSVLFLGSVRFNLDPWGGKIEDVALQDVLEKFELADVVEAMGGLDGEMKEETLSQGQRQIFCFARATLRGGRIVVMDEVTSSIDPMTERRFQHLMRNSFSGRTLIVIAHRLESILDFDRVALLDEGRLVEFDSPAALLGTNSRFRELVEVYRCGDQAGSSCLARN